jgi:hypothetical protein
MKRGFIIPATFAILCSCSEVTHKTELIADMNGTYKDPLYLNYLNLDYEPVDTAKLGKDGVFSFDLTSMPFGLYQLKTKNGNSVNFIYDTAAVLKINSFTADFSNMTMTQTQSSKRMNECQTVIEGVRQSISKLYSWYGISDINQIKIPQRDSLINQISSIRKRGQELIDSILIADNYGFATVVAVRAGLDNNVLYNIITDNDKLSVMAQKLNNRYPGNNTAAAFGKSIEKIERQLKKMKNLELGSTFIDLKVMAVDSSIIKYAPNSKKAFFIHSYNRNLKLENHFRDIIQPLSNKGYEIIEAYTDSIVKEEKTRWKTGKIINPEHYFDDMPLPLIIITDDKMVIVENMPAIENLLELIPKL